MKIERRFELERDELHEAILDYLHENNFIDRDNDIIDFSTLEVKGSVEEDTDTYLFAINGASR